MPVIMTHFIKNTFILLVLGSIVIIHSRSVNAQPLNINRSIISIGVVNGEVINNQYVDITKTISNPILLSVRQQDIKTTLHDLVIDNATLNENNNGNTTITVTKPLANGVMMVRVVLSLWLNGQSVNMVGEQKGTTVRLIIPAKFTTLEVKTVEPLRIQLPLSYQGPFDFTLDITGWRD